MPRPEITELLATLDQIIASSNEGKIDWIKLNPTTVAWNFQSPNPGRIIIQQLMRNEPVSTTPGMMRIVQRYLFQVVDNKTGAQKISIDSADDPQLEQKIKTLFSLASVGVSRSGLDFLKSILPS